MNIKRFLRRLRTEASGNVLMIFGFAVVPMTFATAMGVDYAHAARLQTKMNSLADAAALAAVTQTMMSESDATAESTARAMFNAQADALEGVSEGSIKLTVTITNPNGNGSRNAVVSYTALAKNSFAGILGSPTIEIGGSSTAKNLVAPNIDFYLALDTSPSMALPTTSDGLALLDSKLGCTFACHSNKVEVNTPKFGGASMSKGLITGSAANNPYNINYTLSGPFVNAANGQTFYKIDSKGSYIYSNAPATKTIADTRARAQCADGSGYDTCVYNNDGTFVDSYWYALNQNVHLRVTDERAAASDLMTLAQSYATANKRTYRAALYTFDHSTNLKKIYPEAGTLPTLSADLPAVSTAAGKIDLVTVNDRAGNGRSPSNEHGSEYKFSSFKSILDKMTTELPAKAGKGSDDPNDTPQGYLFIVTDGMSDEQASIIGAPYSLGADRTRSEIVKAHIDQCNAIKARGFKIAILYTEYTTESIKDDEKNQRDFVTANIPKVAPALTACASPGLMYTVKTDESISEALKALFSIAVDTARITR